MIKTKLEEIKYHIQHTALKGEEAHQEMTPTHRRISAKNLKGQNIRKASVLIVLYENKEQFYVPLIERHVYDGNHSGEIGLPGGKIEDVDKNPREAALRETQEELGIEPSEVEIIKELTPIYIPPSNFLVQPYVGLLSTKPSYIPDPIEVKEVIDLPILELLNEHNKKKAYIGKKHIQNTVPVFQIENHIIWGATACILNELKYLLKNC